MALDDYFARANRKERKYLKSYQEIESICIPKVKFRHEANTGIGTDGSLSINRLGIGNLLRESYSRCLDLSICTRDKKEHPLNISISL